MKRFGCHVTIPRKGIITDTSLTAMAFFVSSNRQWVCSTWSPKEIQNFKDTLRDCPNLIDDTIIVHGCYLINLASDDSDVRRKSQIKLEQELQQCEELGLTRYVLHPGTCKDHSVGITRIRDGLLQALSRTKNIHILIENMTGTNKFCQTWEEWRDVIDMCDSPRITACLDTAHAWGAGWEMDEILDNFERYIGLEKLDAIHLNDSKATFHSNKDLHEDLLDGNIPTDFFRWFVFDPRIENIPAILETPTNCHPKLIKYIKCMDK